MAFCSNCGTSLQDGARFCASCGTPVGGGPPAPPKPAAEKTGNIRKCPTCGAEVPTMVAVCSFCGHELSNVQVSSTVQDFFEKYDAIIQDAYEKNSAKEGDWAGALGAVFADAFRGGGGTSASVKRQIGLIESYPIPNTKEDILEFALLASSRYKGVKEPSLLTRGMTGGNEKLEAFKLDEAWKAKCEQAYTKAKISFGSDRDAIAEIENILKRKKII